MKSTLKFALLAMLFVVSYVAEAQYRPLLPRTLPSPNSRGYYKIGYVQADSGYLFTTRDTMWRPKFPTLTYWQRTGVDSSFWFWNLAKWQRLISSGSGGGTNLPVDWTLGYPLYDARYAAISHTHTFGSLTSKPTTLAGYGITDAITAATAAATYSPIGHAHTFASLTSKPTTLAGYGITDAITSALAASTYAPLSRAIPAGGTIGQYLGKASATDYHVSWQTIPTSTSWNGMFNGVQTNVGSVTMTNAFQAYSYTGTGGHTNTLPSLAVNNNRGYIIKNRGTGTLTIARAGSDLLFDGGDVTSITLEVGASAWIWGDAARWNVFKSGGTGGGGTTYTASLPLGIVSNDIRVVDSTSAGGLVTNQRLDSLLEGGIVGFQVAEGLVGVEGQSGAQDTIIIQDDGVTNDKIAVASKIGLLANLNTTDKTSIVAAINEIEAGIAAGGWTLAGNSISTGDFIGTTNDLPLELKVNNLRAGRIGGYTGYSTAGSNVVWSGLTPANTTYGLTLLGREAGVNLTGLGLQNSNTIIGHKAMYKNLGAAEQNTFVGDHAGYYIMAGIRNVFIGQNAGMRTWSANSNVGVGSNVLELNGDGAANTAIGPNTMRSNIDGSNNTAVGNTALGYNSTGILSIPITAGGSGYTTATVTISAPLGGSPGGAVATATGTAVISGGAVTGITMTNHGAGYANTIRTYEWGAQAPLTVTITGDGTGATAGTPVLASGNFNAALGRSAGTSNIIGSYNVWLGNESTSRVNDNYMSFLGASSGVGAGAPSTPLSNAGAWGYNAKVEASNTYVVGTSADKLAVGRTTAAESGHFNGAIVVGNSIGTTNGTIRYTGSAIEARVGDAWVDLAGAGGGTQDVVKIATLSPSGVSTYDVDLTSYISTYSTIEIRFLNVVMGAAANYIRVRVSPDASTFNAGATEYGSTQNNFTAGGAASNVSSDHFQVMDRLTATAGYASKTTLTIDHPNNATLFPMIAWNTQRFGWDSAFGRDVGFGYVGTAQITRAIRIYSDQNFTGTIQIWGYK